MHMKNHTHKCNNVCEICRYILTECNNESPRIAWFRNATYPVSPSIAFVPFGARTIEIPHMVYACVLNASVWSFALIDFCMNTVIIKHHIRKKKSLCMIDTFTYGKNEESLAISLKISHLISLFKETLNYLGNHRRDMGFHHSLRSKNSDTQDRL